LIIANGNAASSYNIKPTAPAPRRANNPLARFVGSALLEDEDEEDPEEPLTALVGPVGVFVADPPVVDVIVDWPEPAEEAVAVERTVLLSISVPVAPAETAVPVPTAELVKLLVKPMAAQILAGRVAKSGEFIRQHVENLRFDFALTGKITSTTCGVLQAGLNERLQLGSVGAVAGVIAEAAANGFDGCLVARDLY
jgi:hypothetical protein